jgi:hypothetical protein
MKTAPIKKVEKSIKTVSSDTEYMRESAAQVR